MSECSSRLAIPQRVVCEPVAPRVRPGMSVTKKHLSVVASGVTRYSKSAKAVTPDPLGMRRSSIRARMSYIQGGSAASP
eukprot:2800784-Amphidinium_carterae.1